MADTGIHGIPSKGSLFEGVRELDAVLKVQEAGNAQTLFSLDLAVPLYNPACP